MKKGGIFKNIKALIVFIVLSALFLAALSQFNWDVFEMIKFGKLLLDWQIILLTCHSLEVFLEINKGKLIKVAKKLPNFI